MAQAFILINTEVGSETLVASKLRTINTIKEVYIVYGIYDILVKIEGNDLNFIRKIIIDQIRKIKNITATITLITHENTEVIERLEEKFPFKVTKKEKKRISAPYML